MSLFDFSSLFASYSVSFTWIPKSQGRRDYSKGGQWVEGAPEGPVELTGIAVPLSNEDLRFDTAGTYLREDLKLYVRFPRVLNKSDSVVIRGAKYRVMLRKEYQPEYADFNIYIIRRTDIEGGETG